MSGGFGLGGAFLGAASVELFADTKPLIAGLEKAKGETAAASGQMSKSTAGFSKVALAAYAVAGAAVVKFAIDAIKSAEAHQVALGRLAIAAGANTQAFAQLAAAQVSLTGFTEDNIIAAETQLSRLHLTADQMKTLLPLTEDLARATGTDLASAAATVEKGLLGMSRGLKGVGIQFKVTGDFTKDFVNLTKQLTAQVGGSAAAWAKSTAGQVAILGAEYDKLKIDIGTGLLPILVGLVKTATELIPLFRFLGYTLLSVVGVVRLGVAALKDFGATVLTFLDHVLGPLYDYNGAIDATGASYRATNADIKAYLDSTKGIPPVVDDAASHIDAAGRRVRNFAGLTTTAFQTWHDTTLKSFDGVKDALDGLANKAKVTATSVINAFLSQANALSHYTANLETVQRRNLPDAVLKQLLSMGLQGKLIINQLATANAADFKREVDAMQRAINQSKRLSDALNALDGTNVSATINIDTVIHGGRPGDGPHPHNATGTSFFSGGLTWLNERGPELVNLPRGSSITPNNKLGGGTTIVVNINAGSVIAERDLIRSIQQGLIRTGIRNGGRTGL